MKAVAGFAAVVLLLAAGASAQEAQLQNRKTIFSIAQDESPAPMSSLGAMRLLGDGNRLLYIRAEKAADKPADFTGPWSGRLYRLVLRDVSSGKEAVMPGAAMTWDDPMPLLVRLNPVDQDGKRLAVYATTEGTGDGFLSGRSENMTAGVVDLASGRLAKMKIAGPIVLPMFAGNGKDLLVVNWSKNEMKGQVLVQADPNAEPRALSVSAIPLAVATGTDLVAFMTLQKSPQTFGLFVHDVKTDSTIASLTLDPKNSHLSNYSPQWTADGKHLYYYDVEEQSPAPDGPPTNVDAPANRKEFTRVWGVKQKGEVARLDNVIPVGAGPGGTMVLAARNGGKVVVHDAARGATFPLNDAQIIPIWAGGGKVICRGDKPDASGKTDIFLADIVLPATPTSAFAPAGK